MYKKYLITLLLIIVTYTLITPYCFSVEEADTEIDILKTALYIGDTETTNPKIKADLKRQEEIINEIIIDSKTLEHTIQNSLNLNKNFDDLIIEQARVWKKAATIYPELMPCYEQEKEIIKYLLVFKMNEDKYITELNVINKEIEKENNINETPVYQSQIKSYLYDRLIKTYLKINLYNKLKYTDLLAIITNKDQEQINNLKTFNIPEHIVKQIEYLQRKKTQTANISLNNLAEISKNIKPISAQLEEIDSIQNDIVTNIITDLKKQIKEYKNRKTNEINEQEIITNDAIKVLESTIELYETLKKEIDKETKAYLPNNNILLAYDKDNNNFQVPIIPPIWEQNKTTIDIIGPKNKTTIGPIPKTTIGPAKSNQQTNTGNANPYIKTQKETQPNTFQQNVQWITNCFDAFDKEVTSSLTNGINFWTGDKPMTRKKREAIENGWTVGTMKFVLDAHIDVIRSFPQNTACVLDDRKSYTEKALCTTGIIMDVVPIIGTAKKIISNNKKTMKTLTKESKQLDNMLTTTKNKIDELENTVTQTKRNVKNYKNRSKKGTKLKQKQKNKNTLNKQLKKKKEKYTDLKNKKNDIDELIKQPRKTTFTQVVEEEFSITPENIFIEGWKKTNLKVVEDLVTKKHNQVVPILQNNDDQTPQNNPNLSNVNNQSVPIIPQNITPQVPLVNPNVPNMQPNNFAPNVPQEYPPNNQASYIGPPNNQTYIGPPNNQTYIGPTNNQTKPDPFADVMNTVRQNQEHYNKNRGQQNTIQQGPNNNQVSNNFDTGFNNGSNKMNNRINNLTSLTGNNNQPNTNCPDNNNVNPPYRPTNNYQNKYDGYYSGTFTGTQSQTVAPNSPQYGGQQGSYGSINYGMQNGVLAIDWSGNISFTINGQNITGYLTINGMNGNEKYPWQGIIDTQTGQFRANDNTISGIINNNRASGIVPPGSTFEAYKQ